MGATRILPATVVTGSTITKTDCAGASPQPCEGLFLALSAVGIRHLPGLLVYFVPRPRFKAYRAPPWRDISTPSRIFVLMTNSICSHPSCGGVLADMILWTSSDITMTALTHKIFSPRFNTLI